MMTQSSVVPNIEVLLDLGERQTVAILQKQAKDGFPRWVGQSRHNFYCTSHYQPQKPASTFQPPFHLHSQTNPKPFLLLSFLLFPSRSSLTQPFYL